MTYLITGELVLQEKPEKYLNHYVSLIKEEHIDGNHTHTGIDIKITNLESLAENWRSSGRPLEFVTSLERAREFCKKQTLEIHDSKFLTPKHGWEDYLTKKYGTWDDGHDKYTALKGEIIVWKQTRLPLPWIYCYASGTPAGYFTARNGVIFQPKNVQFTGKINSTGLAIDTKIINCQFLSTEKITTKREFGIPNNDYSVSCQVTETNSKETKRKFSVF